MKKRFKDDATTVEIPKETHIELIRALALDGCERAQRALKHMTGEVVMNVEVKERRKAKRSTP